MTTEQKQLVEDAARLLGFPSKGPASKYIVQGVSATAIVIGNAQGGDSVFDPYDPERGDLMRVERAGWMTICHENGMVSAPLYNSNGFFEHTHNELFDTDDYQSLANAVLRAASAVLKARGEE